ncbi:MAG: hypothetical protein ACYC64_08580 [Armatimonadota bacterium]
MMNAVVVAIMLVLSAGAPVMACYSGLLVIPTADLVPVGQYSLETQYDFSTPISSDTSTLFFNTQFGLAKGLELGVDFDLSHNADGRVIGNGKYVFDILDMPLAFGFSSINSRFKSLPYTATIFALPFGRVHLGLLGSEGRTRWFTGVDRALGDKWTAMADYSSGEENYASAALNYAVSDSFGVLAGTEFPNDGSPVIYSIHLVVCGSLFSK